MGGISRRTTTRGAGQGGYQRGRQHGSRNVEADPDGEGVRIRAWITAGTAGQGAEKQHSDQRDAERAADLLSSGQHSRGHANLILADSG